MSSLSCAASTFLMAMSAMLFCNMNCLFKYTKIIICWRIIPEEDIQLNSRVFLWPKDMEQVLDLSSTRISHRREIAEGVLRNKCAEFEQVLVLTT